MLTLREKVNYREKLLSYICFTFQVIKKQKEIILGLTSKIEKSEIENVIEEGDTDSGVVTTDEYKDSVDITKVGEYNLENKVNRSVSNVMKAERYKNASQIPRMAKTSFAPTGLNFTCGTKSKTITRSRSKTLDQLRARLSGRGRSFSTDRCSMA